MATLEEIGRVRVVWHCKGHVNRVILLRGKDHPHETTLRDYQGQGYSFEQHLPDRTAHGSSGRCKAATVMRSSRRTSFVRFAFRVLLDCLAPAI